MKTAQWSPADLRALRQALPEQGIKGAAEHSNHSFKETYAQAFALGYTPPNGRGPWPEHDANCGWPAADVHILRQEYTSPASIDYIAEILERPPREVKNMAKLLGIAVAPGHKPKKLKAEPAADVIAEAIFETAAHTFSTGLASAQLPDLEESELPPDDWTPAMDAYLRDNYHKIIVKEIASTLGVSHNQAAHRARKLGLGTPQPSWTREETIYLLENIQSQSLADIAKHLGRTTPAVNLRPKQLGIFPGWTAADDKVLLKMRGEISFEAIGRMINRPAYAVERRMRFLTDDAFEFSAKGIRRLFAEKGKHWIRGLIYLKVRKAHAEKHQWTEAEKDFVRNNFPSKGAVWCGKELGIPTNSVRHKAAALGVVNEKPTRPWTSEEEDWLRENVLVLDRKTCAEYLNRSVAAVSVRASVIGAFNTFPK